MHSRGTLAMGLPVFPARGGPVSALFGATSVTALAGAPASLVATFQHNPFGFGVIYAACDLLIPLNLGLAPVAGALYGLPKALLVVLVAGVIAAAAAFSIGRKCRDRLVGWLEAMPSVQRRFAFMDRAITNGGFKALLLLRLVPTPVPALNYLYGITGVRMRDYVLATMIGNVPGTAAAVGGGVVGKRILSALTGSLRFSRHAYWLGGLGLLLGAVTCQSAVRVVSGAKLRLESLAQEGCESAVHVTSEQADTLVPLLVADSGTQGVDDGCHVDECRPWSAEAAVECAFGIEPEGRKLHHATALAPVVARHLGTDVSQAA